ncbi:RDD family protein [Microbacterium sp.]|uniref:RDD family protein n=1 Tax=Microbacterium sp. TaxID=51671 RepID=UPI003736D2D4
MIWEVDQPERSVDGLDADGRPDPAYAAALGLVPAPYGRRALAYVIDLAAFGLLQLPLWLGAMPLVFKMISGAISPYGLVNHPDFVLAVVMASISTALLLAFSIVQWVLHGRRGLTIGKAIVGIRSVNVRSLERPGAWVVLLRLLLVSVAGVVPVVGTVIMLASPTFDPQQRGRALHDRATRMWLVDIRRGLNPYDEKRMRIARKSVTAEPVPEREKLPSLATAMSPGEPGYRPGSRISAGVLGVGRPADLSTSGGSIPERPVPLAPSPAAPAAAPAAPVPTPAVTPAPVPTAKRAVVAEPVAGYALRFDTGQRVEIAGPTLLGRDPDAGAQPGAALASVADESRSLSKTHALVRVVDGGMEIVDWHSTNGCAVIRGGVERELEPGIPALVVEGDGVRLGDRHAEVIRS